MNSSISTFPNPALATDFFLSEPNLGTVPSGESGPFLAFTAELANADSNLVPEANVTTAATTATGEEVQAQPETSDADEEAMPVRRQLRRTSSEDDAVINELGFGLTAAPSPLPPPAEEIRPADAEVEPGEADRSVSSAALPRSRPQLPQTTAPDEAQGQSSGTQESDAVSPAPLENSTASKPAELRSDLRELPSQSRSRSATAGKRSLVSSPQPRLATNHPGRPAEPSFLAERPITANRLPAPILIEPVDGLNPVAGSGDELTPVTETPALPKEGTEEVQAKLTEVIEGMTVIQPSPARISARRRGVTGESNSGNRPTPEAPGKPTVVSGKQAMVTDGSAPAGVAPTRSLATPPPISQATPLRAEPVVTARPTPAPTPVALTAAAPETPDARPVAAPEPTAIPAPAVQPKPMLRAEPVATARPTPAPTAAAPVPSDTRPVATPEPAAIPAPAAQAKPMFRAEPVVTARPTPAPTPVALTAATPVSASPLPANRKALPVPARDSSAPAVEDQTAVTSEPSAARENSAELLSAAKDAPKSWADLPVEPAPFVKEPPVATSKQAIVFSRPTIAICEPVEEIARAVPVTLDHPPTRHEANLVPAPTEVYAINSEIPQTLVQDKPAVPAAGAIEEFIRTHGAPTHKPPLAGTPAAQQPPDMKQSLQREQFAGSAAVPAMTRQGMAGNVLSALRRLPSLPDSERTEEDIPSPSLLQAGGGATGTTFSTESHEARPAAEPTRNLAPMIQDHIVNFRKAGLESLQVVLKPDSGTELHLHLTQHGGQIEVQIRCDRGDAQQLGAGWSRLQETFAQNGIRLAPLEGGSMFSSGDQFGRQQGSPRQPQNPTDWLIPAPILPALPRTLSSNATHPTSRPPVLAPQRVLESWA